MTPIYAMITDINVNIITFSVNDFIYQKMSTICCMNMDSKSIQDYTKGTICELSYDKILQRSDIIKNDASNSYSLLNPKVVHKFSKSIDTYITSLYKVEELYKEQERI